ncbi:MAG: hypothetical protein SRB2_01014 [Desulfobacteraceae bacterium Eth-SRB2]|nr:MAG: hypothetical protein SRB2_01014 [Desulfobacteraceae bacterium Eth-SRB2]
MKLIRKVNVIKSVMAILFILTILFANNVSYADIRLTKGQTVYLSLYPKIERAGKMAPNFLITILTIRNTDLRYPITVNSINYHDSNGALKKQVLKEPVILNPISSKSMRFEEKELDTGSGMAGCFIILWESRKKVSEPIVEGIIGKSGTGWVTILVFYGRVIKDDNR